MTERAPHLFFSAGDTSGDQHAARLLTRLRELLPGLTAEGLGGPQLAAAGCVVHTDLVSRAIVGFGAALAAVPAMFGVLRRVAGILDARRPDAVLIVDYPGLNLFVARLAHRRGIPVIYFVAPQLWGWAPWRARRFARVVDEALVIFPFEVPFFRDAGLQATYIGHPLLDALPAGDARAACARRAITSRPRPVALLPGSRPREVRRHMPLLLQAGKLLLERFPDVTFHGAHVAAAERENMAAHAARAGVPLELHGDDVHGVMASCRCAVVASGTATLETGLLGTPMVVVYRFTPTEHLVLGNLIVPPWMGAVNLVAGREVCPELITLRDDPAALAAALEPLLTDSPTWHAQREALDSLRQRLGRGPGAGRAGAIETAAQHLAARLMRTVPRLAAASGRR